MEKLIKEAVYSIPKLNIEEYCKINNTTIEELYNALDLLEDDNLRQLFLNRYPMQLDENQNLNGENIIKQIVKIKHIKIGEIASTYKVSKRTIFRVLKKAEKSNPELYALYKRFNKKQLTREDEELISEMPIEDISIGRRDYDVTKIMTPKTHQSDKVFKSLDDIREEYYDKIAEECETPEELEEKEQDPDLQTLIKNRWKKEKVLIKIFEEECENNLELLHILLGERKTVNRLMDEFRKIDEEDNIAEINQRRRKIEENEPEK